MYQQDICSISQNYNHATNHITAKELLTKLLQVNDIVNRACANAPPIPHDEALASSVPETYSLNLGLNPRLLRRYHLSARQRLIAVLIAPRNIVISTQLET